METMSYTPAVPMPASSTGAYSDVSIAILKDFDIIEQIHHGRCTVYRAKCNKGRLRNRQVALKKVPVPRTSSTACCETLHQALCHPNIASLYSTFSTAIENHQVLELCPSGSLDDYMRSQGSQAIEESRLRKLLKGLFDALGYLKTQRVVHRGIDMSSILLTTVHTLKLSDFKNAIRLPEYEDMTDNPVQHVTEFSAPEIKNFLFHGFPVDMWSAGCVAVACSVKTSNLGVIPRSARVDFKGNLSKMTPSELKDFIHGLLQYEPGDRLSVSEACLHAYFTSDYTRHSELINSRVSTLPRSSAIGPLKFKQLATISKHPGIATVRMNLKDILSDVCSKNAREPLSKTNERRVFSDPVKNTHFERGGMPPARSKSVSVAGSTKYVKVGAPAVTAATKQAIPIGTVRPSPFSTSSLHPRTHKTAYGQLTVLPSRSVLVDFREGQRRKGCKGDEVLVISPSGTEVKVFKAPHLSIPCCLIEPSQKYTLQDIPSTYWDQYNKAADHIDQIKCKTPKLVEYGAGIKYTLMANNPLGDVEVVFDSYWLGDSDGLSSQKKCQPKMRLSLSKKRSSLEIARHMVNGDAEEWTKKVVAAFCDSQYVTSEKEFFQLESIEQKAVHELTKFLSVCVSVENNLEEADTTGGVGSSSAAPISSGGTNVTFSSSLEVEHSSCDTTPEQKVGNSIASQFSGTGATTAEQNVFTTFIQSPMQTRFLASVGWCMRYRTCEIPRSERYQMLFLDGVTMEVDVDQEKVNYTAIDGTKESCSVHDCIFKQDIFKRMQSFEDFVALFEYDT